MMKIHIGALTCLLGAVVVVGCGDAPSARVGGQPLPKLTLMEGTEIPDAGYAIPLSDSAYLPNCDRPENIALVGYEALQITNLDWPQGHQPARLSNHKDWHGLWVDYGPRELPKLYGSADRQGQIVMRAVASCSTGDDGKSVTDTLDYVVAIAKWP